MFVQVKIILNIIDHDIVKPLTCLGPFVLFCMLDVTYIFLLLVGNISALEAIW